MTTYNTHADVQPYAEGNLRRGNKILINAHLQVDGFAAQCGVLTRVEGTSTFGKYSYEPTIFVGTHIISKEQQLELSFVGYILERLQHRSPAAGRIIGMNGISHTVKLDHHAKDLRPLLEPLHEWITVDSPTPPPIVLNKHYPLCPFQRLCHAQAEQEDNLSLLNGVTARMMRQYEKKGIFTVKQLSYLFKPRKRKKGSRKPPPVTHKVELQALAIREHKIYLQELPVLSRQPVELFLDMEGVPDRGFYYLIGLLVCQGNTTEHYSFWANTDQDERHMWQQFMDKVAQYLDAPIYHYGSYEFRAIATLAKRYQTDCEHLLKRLVNFTSQGCRKTVTMYRGAIGYCPTCDKSYAPQGIEQLGGQLFGHGLQAWVIYQRMILRLPYRIIIHVMEEMFGERASLGTILKFFTRFAEYYVPTERLLLQQLLRSPFLHVDETKLSIQGTDQYVWVFTDGKHVVFKLTATRETTLVHEMLAQYAGVLVADFYAGYDAVPCRQQKCLVHLIRDLNDDLWSKPWNSEFESFVFAVKGLLVPIFEAVETYGLKHRHLHKFHAAIDRFYQRHIMGTTYTSETTIKFQKRFQRGVFCLYAFSRFSHVSMVDILLCEGMSSRYG